MRKILIILLILISSFSFSDERRKSFDDYNFLLNYGFIGSGGFSGELMQKERDSWELSVSYSDGSVSKGKPLVSRLPVDISLQYLIKRFGIYVFYSPYFLNEEVSVGDGETYEKISFKGDLIQAHLLGTGVGYHFIIVGGMFDLFIALKGGYIFGDLIPYPSLIDYLKKELGVSVSPEKFSFNGYQIYPEIGISLIGAPIILGFSIGYSFNNLYFSKSLRNFYDSLDKNVTFTHFNFILNVGLLF
ncbi:MAG: hypothetical protein ACP5Q5_08355 [Brevinematia bacterium]